MSVFVDSDAFVALAKADDSNHSQALAILDRLKKDETNTFVTSNYVFAETITVISYRISHAAALDFVDGMTAAESQFMLQRHTEETERLALQIFRDQTSKNVSFVDCTNMAFVRFWKLDAIFSFDDIYRRNRFLMIDSPEVLA